jgi:iodotyrosine deiodinase
MTRCNTVPLPDYRPLPVEEMKRRAAEFYAQMRQRRSVRDFSDGPIPREVIEDCLRAAGTAPSGANMQPWHFVVVSDPQVKRRIRQAAEEVEREFYARRAPRQWLDALAPLGTDAGKPFLETAPYLIVVFVRPSEVRPDGSKLRHYYPTESAGIATGLLITALCRAGLVSLPYTPSPMGFLREILPCPQRARPMLILVTGLPAEGAMVPDISKKPLEEIATFV